jgi:hypothetical protein
MTRLLLYSRSRRIEITLASVALLAVIMFLFGTLPMASFGARQIDVTVPLFTIIPLLCACVITVPLNHPFGELEQLSGYPIARLRITHLLFVLSVTILLLSFSLPPQTSSDTYLVVIRNLIGYTGLATLGVWLVGNRLSWLFPFTVFWVTRLNGLVAQGNNNLVWADWAWAFLPGTDLIAFFQALVLGIVGIGIFAVKGTRSSNPSKM